ncbi:Histidine kinase [Ekhidna lutea]|uniref:histidine kinase n=1 Tax=Ekhidna lutea TaxID=447679 RepID=A0A239K6D1_EKHLU|nr:sensor histidine kinase [Ekhidna lutea]SNT13169.1 Histidine kinase [Ekhidna lutea]
MESIAQSINYNKNLRNRISGILFNILLIIPLLAVLIIVMNFTLGNITVAAVVFSIIPICLVCIWLLKKKGSVRLTMSILIGVLLAVSIGACTFGKGIHAIGIVILPVIIVFSSLVLSARGILFTVLGCLAGIAWLTLGDIYGLYEPNYNSPTSFASMVVIFSILFSHLFVSFSLVKATKKGINEARDEVLSQRKIQKEISSNLEVKTLLLQQIHHRVKNNLALINSLIDLQMFENKDSKELLHGLQDRVETIARAHDPLYHTDDYREVSLKPYFEKLLSTFMMSSNNYDIKFDLIDVQIFHEKALSAGIFLQEALSLFNKIDQAELFVFTSIETGLLISVESKTGHIADIESRLEVMLLKLMAENNHAQLTISPNSASITLNV